MASRRRAAKRILGAALGAAVGLGLVEAGAVALVRAGALAAPRPHHGKTGFWWHNHPDYGAWHHADSEGNHNGPCYKARYRTNSVGARDRERPRAASRPRVVMLGDSFVEGYGLDAESRLSDMLEAATGVPHMNFAMASFGPYQELLVYEAVARAFDHDTVVVSVFPGNDFAELDPEDCKTLGDPDYCFRPFLVGEPPALERLDRREPELRRQLRLHSQAWNALAAALRGRRQPTDARSLFYDFEPRQAEKLEAVLGRFVAAAGDRQLVVLLIPKQLDLEVFAARGPDPLSARLEAWARPHGARVVNLLPGMARPGRSWDAYYLSCDFHWNRYGNRVAADLVLEALADLYGRPAASDGARPDPRPGSGMIGAP